MGGVGGVGGVVILVGCCVVVVEVVVMVVFGGDKEVDTGCFADKVGGFLGRSLRRFRELLGETLEEGRTLRQMREG